MSTNLTKEDAARGGKNSSRKGVSNVVTKEVKSVIEKIVSGNTENFETWMKNIAAKDEYKACMVYIKLLPYVAPQLSKVESNDGTDFKPLYLQINMQGDEDKSDTIK